MQLCQSSPGNPIFSLQPERSASMPIGRFLSTPQNLLGLPLVFGIPACSSYSSAILPWSQPQPRQSLFVFFSLLQLCPVLGLCSCSSVCLEDSLKPSCLLIHPVHFASGSQCTVVPSDSLSYCANRPHICPCRHLHRPSPEAVTRLSFTDRCNLIPWQCLLQEIVRERHGCCSFCSPLSWP